MVALTGQCGVFEKPRRRLKASQTGHYRYIVQIIDTYLDYRRRFQALESAEAERAIAPHSPARI